MLHPDTLLKNRMFVLKCRAAGGNATPGRNWLKPFWLKGVSLKGVSLKGLSFSACMVRLLLRTRWRADLLKVWVVVVAGSGCFCAPERLLRILGICS